MSRIETAFARLREAGRKALVPYVTAGDPNPGVTVPVMHAMVEAGASIIELGVPFSDPMADGPVIQRATERALMHDVTLDNVLDMVREFREQDDTTPVVLMGYLNPVEVMGYARFAQKASDAGVDGVLTVDLPPEEAGPLREALRAHGLDPIFLLAPTTDDTRINAVTNAAGGFVYYVSLKGVTGAANLDVDGVARRVAHIRALTLLPVGVGFGIKDAATAAAVAEFADAVVVGSALVRIFEQHVDAPAEISVDVAALIRELRAAMDA
ncbi:MAG: tryptophan synthase subunit alpha [Pseudomonadota bacterium]|nr:MAG: tryptophan synthase subunit alpha [Pseudomonadota bacterium]